jgi:putative membrane protein
VAQNAYLRFRKNELILRDELAVDRTLLANERTLLAYLRSAVSLIIAGVSMIHFSGMKGWFLVVGIACIPLGIAIGIFGIMRFVKMNSDISTVRTQVESLTSDNSVKTPAD